MGTFFGFVCGCGYTCEVSGGPDVGMRCQTRTVVCASCRTVENAVSKDLGQDGEWTTVKVTCPTCHGPVKAWPRRHPCPKCGTPMTTLGEVCLWD